MRAGRRDAFGVGRRRRRRTFRNRHRPRPRERDQDARASATRDARRRAVPAHRARRRHQRECDSQGSDRELLGLPRARDRVPRRGRAGGGDGQRGVCQDRPRRRRDRGARSRCGRCVDRRGDTEPARPDRDCPERAARHELGLPGAGRDEHLARRSAYRGRATHAAQPVALVERLGASRLDRHARCCRAARRRHLRGDPVGSRMAARSGLARPGRLPAGLRAPLRRGADRHCGACLARDGSDRRAGARTRHGVVRPADRGGALTRRAGQHPDGRALLAAARRSPRRTLGSP